MNTECYDVVVVGTGAAGLFCALSLPETLRVLMITKQEAEQSDSFLAQGGICVLRGEEDYEDFFRDTMRAGHYENNADSVALMIRSSNAVIRQLLRLGVRFERLRDGSLAYTKEGGHSKPRILFHEDVTGREITGALLRQAQGRPNIAIREHTTMVDLIAQGNVCGGVVAADSQGEPFLIQTPSVVLACGGLGGLYKNSTNFPHITGDALAVALNRGVALEHLDYIQIHPTTLFSQKPGRRFLISESVRGEGALLYGKNGQRFTNELQPRDVLSQAIFRQLEKDGTEFVWEDMRPLGEQTILSHFPNIYQRCLEEGFNVLTQPIPVTPAQHYFMGGIRVNLASQTSMTGLYAVGETSCNGVHGRNRLASNSLLESLVFAQRAAEDIAFGSAHPGCGIQEIDLEDYRDLPALFAGYAEQVRAAILESSQARAPQAIRA
ncbi:MAG: L-aspartate oxidase [Oscillospiraceae bacterium]|nr:L-aspartate oxidase [Oscillospiraceae bacterium]